MVDLVLRPSSLEPNRPFALQLRWHESLGETEYVTLARVEQSVADEVIRAGAAYYLFGEPADGGTDLKAENASLRQQLADARESMAEEAAAIIDKYSIQHTAGAPVLTKRMEGDRYGLAYAAAIRALADREGERNG